MITADYHLHSHNSGDSKAPMEAMITSAIANGLKYMCFTEHMDLDFPISDDTPEGTYEVDIPSYKKELLFYKDKYRDKISINYGIEIGLQPQVVKANQELVSSNDFDFVIGSQHLIDRQDPYYSSFWEGKDEKASIRKYFEETYDNLKLFSDIDVLGHIDYAVRYTPSKGASYDPGDYMDIIDEILTYIIKKDIGIDLNTSALSKGLNNPNPHPLILKRYKELGGNIITFGSDAHVPENVAGHFEDVREIAISCGFTEYYTFEARQKTSHRL